MTRKIETINGIKFENGKVQIPFNCSKAQYDRWTLEEKQQWNKQYTAYSRQEEKRDDHCPW